MNGRSGWRWAVVPLLAGVAFAPVLTLWFVGDDFFFLLLRAHGVRPGLTPFLWFEPGFYRPLGMVITWNLGYALFGLNALPYHALGLLLHMLVAWLLGRAVAAVAGDAVLGWLAGALFAVYPLTTEPVAWISDQWDAGAAACVLGAVWAFAVAWRRRSGRAYWLALLCAVAGLLTKESALGLPLVLPLVAVVTELNGKPGVGADGLAGRRSAALGRRVVMWTLPFFGLLLVYVGALLLGGFKSYPGTRNDYQDFFWEAIAGAALRCIMPLNGSVFPTPATQLAGLVLGGGLAAGLVVWGRRRALISLLAGAWFLAFLAPVLNMVPTQPDTANNRYLYLSAMGLCLAGAGVLSGLLDGVGRRRTWGWVGVAALLALAVPAVWVELRPWVQASHQTRQIAAELGELLPVVPGGPVRMDVQNLPVTYEGSFVFLLGFDQALELLHGQPTQHRVMPADSTLDVTQQADVPYSLVGTYGLSFTLGEHDQLNHVGQWSGITMPVEPLAGDQVWDYRACGPAQSTGWLANNATFSCVAPAAGSGDATHYAHFAPATGDGQLLLPKLGVDLRGARGIRLAVSARLPVRRLERWAEWFWLADGKTSIGPAQSWRFRLSRAGLHGEPGPWRVYWAYLPVERVGQRLDLLRFDPIDEAYPVDIQWLALGVIR